MGNFNAFFQSFKDKPFWVRWSFLFGWTGYERKDRALDFKGGYPPGRDKKEVPYLGNEKEVECDGK